MSPKKTVKIDAFPESAFRYLGYDAIVCVDVIRATTTAVTAVAQDRRVFPVASVEDAFVVAGRLKNPLLAGAVKGIQPAGFEIADGPAALVDRADTDRPMVLVSSSGTQLIVNASQPGSTGGPDVYVACLRNMNATVQALATGYHRVGLLGAGAKGEFRCEDQMGTAWIGGKLLAEGFEPEDDSTAQLIERWSHADVALVAWGNSADELRRANRTDDLDFVMGHVDDLDLVCRYEREEVVRGRARPAAKAIIGSSGVAGLAVAPNSAGA